MHHPSLVYSNGASRTEVAKQCIIVCAKRGLYIKWAIKALKNMGYTNARFAEGELLQYSV